MRSANGRPGEHTERARDQRDQQRLAGDQSADLRRRRAERAQHGGLPAALGDGQRERPGDDEQGDRAGDAAQRAEDGDEPGTIRGGRIPGVGIGSVLAIEDVEPAPETLLQAGAAGRPRGRSGLGDHADRVDLSGRAGQCAAATRCGEEDGGLAPVTGSARVGKPLTRKRASPAGRDDAQRPRRRACAAARRPPRRRPAGRAPGRQAIRRKRRAVPAVADQPVGALGARGGGRVRPTRRRGMRRRPRRGRRPAPRRRARPSPPAVAGRGRRRGPRRPRPGRW